MSGLSMLTTTVKHINKLSSIARNADLSDKFISVIRGNRSRYLSALSHSQLAQGKEEWYLTASVCIERIPLITPPLTNIERTMIEHLKQIEFENSKRSDFELRHEADIEAAEKRKLDGTKLASGTRTAEDDHDAWLKDKQGFVCKSKLTNADESNDQSSPVRCLDRPLYLTIERNFAIQNNPKGNPEFNWDLPGCIRREGESMRQTAERAVKDTCGSDLEVQILGNAPWAFMKYKYTNKIKDLTGRKGEKIFIYKAHYQSGQVKKQENISRNFRWSAINELDLISPKLRLILNDLVYYENEDL